MKTLASFMILFLLAGFCVAAGETRENPVAVSPGSETGLATVSQSCPTFSWSAVEQASSYWIAVFQSPDAVVRSYADIAVIASPVIVKEIAGPALSWTLPAEERLQNGALYAWYVQAVDSAGNRLGSCSTARVFKVEQEAAWAGMDGKMAFVNGTARAAQSIDGQANGGTEGPNTFYGQGAGAGITAGVGDTFIGRNAGISNTSGSYNTFLGSSAGYSNTSGGANVFLGDSSGYSNTTGVANVFIGNVAGRDNTTGYNNIFLGYSAGDLNTTAFDNIFLGYYAGHHNLSGSTNTFIGHGSGYSNTTGAANVFLGYFTGYKNTTGGNNTFLGYLSGYANSTGHSNTFLGYWSGYSNTTGHNNSFLGNYAGFSNMTGIGNSFYGREAGYSNSDGGGNTFIGGYAGNSNTTANRNTFIGYESGHSNTTGYSNTFIGDYAGYANITGNNNIFIGSESGFYEAGSNKLYIDNSNTSDPLIYGDFGTNIVTINGKLGIGTKTPGYPLEIVTTGAKASIVVGRPDGAKNWINATTAFGNFGTVNNYPLRLQVNSVARMTLYNDNSLMMANTARLTAGGVWTDASSIALKENISMLGSDEAATTLQALNPVKYNYKADKNENHVGFIAEEVPEMVAMKDRKSLSPMDIVAVLTKVTQDQQKQLQEQKQINEKMKMEIAELQKKLLN